MIQKRVERKAIRLEGEFLEHESFVFCFNNSMFQSFYKPERIKARYDSQSVDTYQGQIERCDGSLPQA